MDEEVKEEMGEGVRTYASDIAEMMKREKGSIIKIALAEQRRQQEFKNKMDPTATRNVIVVMLGVILVVAGIIIFALSVINRAKPVEVINSLGSLPTFFFTENQAHINASDLNRTELLNAIQNRVNAIDATPGSFNNLFISNQTLAGQTQMTAQTFLQKLGIEAPESLFQNLQSSFMLGTYAGANSNELFLIFKVKDFNDAFLAMRDWEGTMLGEFLRTFNIDTSAYGNMIFSKPFVTETLFNKEARLLKDSTGKTLIYYIFLDQKSILISTKTGLLQEVIKRMNLQTIK